MNIKKIHTISAFTLLELSLTIFIIGIVLITGISFQISLVDNTSKNLTLDKMNRIQKSLREYILANGKLPCPASLLVSNDSADYGKELRNSSSGKCIYANSNFYNSSKKIIYGAIPTKVLDLSNDYGWDNWRNRIVYAIKEDYGNRKGFLTGSGNAITIRNLNNDIITDEAVYIMFSSGKNKNGAFRDGKQMKIDSSLPDKENAFSNGFNGIFIKDVADDEFDDIVYYKDKSELLLKLGFEEALCNLEDLAKLDSKWNYTTHVNCPDGVCQQGIEIMSNTTCDGNYFSKNPNKNPIDSTHRPVRKCLKYGKWSDIIYPCVQGCGVANIFSLNQGNFYKSGEPQSSISINLDYLKRTRINETATFECNGSRVGFVKLRCSKIGNTDQGEWEYMGGECIDSGDLVE